MGNRIKIKLGTGDWLQVAKIARRILQLGACPLSEAAKGGLAVLLLMLLIIAPLQAEPIVELQSLYRQGDVIFATIKGIDEKAAGTVSFLGNEYPFFNDGGYMRVILPIPVETKPGKAQIKFLIKNGENKTEIKKNIIVKSKKFPAQYLSLPAKQKQNYHSKTKDDEDDVLDAKIMTSSGKKLWSGNFLSPCKGPVVTVLGTRRFHNGEYYNYHKGTDIAAPQGAPVYAPGAGKVVFVKYIPAVYGKTIVIDHGWGITSLYLHLSKMEVKENETVKKGQVIARVGTTGTMGSGPHLHWGIFAFGETLNPQCFYDLPEEFK